MRILESMKNGNAYEKWQEAKRELQKNSEKFLDESIDNFNKKYYYNNRKR